MKDDPPPARDTLVYKFLFYSIKSFYRQNPPPIANRTSSITQQKPVIKPIQETTNPLLIETKLNPVSSKKNKTFQKKFFF